MLIAGLQRRRTRAAAAILLLAIVGSPTARAADLYQTTGTLSASFSGPLSGTINDTAATCNQKTYFELDSGLKGTSQFFFSVSVGPPTYHGIGTYVVPAIEGSDVAVRLADQQYAGPRHDYESYVAGSNVTISITSSSNDGHVEGTLGSNGFDKTPVHISAHWTCPPLAGALASPASIPSTVASTGPGPRSASCFDENYSSPVPHLDTTALGAAQACGAAATRLGMPTAVKHNPSAADVTGAFNRDSIIYFSGHSGGCAEPDGQGVGAGFLLSADTPVSHAAFVTSSPVTSPTETYTDLCYQAMLGAYQGPGQNPVTAIPSTHARLVVLQACITAVGRKAPVPDLGDAIQSAGAETVVGFGQEVGFYDADPNAEILGKAWGDAFWQAIGNGASVEASVNDGLNAVVAGGSSGAGPGGLGGYDSAIILGPYLDHVGRQ